MTSERMVLVFVDYLKCSGCRRCEVACSISHEGKIWPEASRIRVFMPYPGVEIPHLCVQCEDYPCVASCPVNALSIDGKTGAVLVDEEKCTGCGSCIEACPGSIPHLHPSSKVAVICDLCGGDPKCVRVCSEGGWNALKLIPREERGRYGVYPRKPSDIARSVAVKLFGSEVGGRLV
ncbi:MAG: 4Fe-4S dicluster domain-containing protein [Candidatus Freyarchaeota archaeon]